MFLMQTSCIGQMWRSRMLVNQLEWRVLRYLCFFYLVIYTSTLSTCWACSSPNFQIVLWIWQFLTLYCSTCDLEEERLFYSTGFFQFSIGHTTRVPTTSIERGCRDIFSNRQITGYLLFVRSLNFRISVTWYIYRKWSHICFHIISMCILLVLGAIPLLVLSECDVSQTSTS